MTNKIKNSREQNSTKSPLRNSKFNFSRSATRFFSAVIFSAVFFGFSCLATHAAIFTVTNANDSGAGSLRAAIASVNAQPTVNHTINFNIGTGLKSINLASPLPAIATTADLTIDGTTQGGFTNFPLIELNGVSAGAAANGLNFNGSSGAVGVVTVKSLIVNRFALNGIRASNVEALNVYGCYIGTDANGSTDLGNGLAGIYLNPAQINSVSNIGSTTAIGRNVISGNNGDGIVIFGYYPADVKIAGNYIGTNASAVIDVGNGGDGVLINDFSNVSRVAIGGIASGQGNVISGNDRNGISIGLSESVTIQGNTIGLGANGSTVIGNAEDGIKFSVQSTTIDNVLIGGSTATAGNTISGNGDDGIEVGYYDFLGLGTISPVIVGNRIGTDLNGANDKGNIGNGILVTGYASPVIGRETAGEGNTIAGNNGAGIYFSGGYAKVYNNRIGVSALGAALGNTGAGIYLNGALGTEIGKENVANSANTIGTNGSHGIFVGGISSNFKIVSNFIGTNANGASLGNGGSGVFVTGSAHDGSIGAANAGSGNTIADNGTGVLIQPQNGFSTPPRAVAVLRNQIYSNTNLGIDLGGNGATANDAQDADTGANDLQNFPVIQGASPAQLNGTLNSTPNQNYRLDFYRVDSCDFSGHGEGRYYLGSLDATTDANGNAAFLANNLQLAAGQIITATATRKYNATVFESTSEFSQCRTVAAQPAGNFSFSSPNYYVSESVGSTSITVNRIGGSAGVATVQYNSSSGTATINQDYTPVVGTLTFLDGESSKTFTINITDDERNEPAETINFQLSNPTGGAAIVNPATAVLTVNDNDNPPSVSASNVVQTEGNAGIKNFTFTIASSQPSDFPISVNYQTADLTASAGIDYTAANGTINFAPGETSKQINVSVNGDLIVETDETFALNLLSPTNATIGSGAVGTIKDDDNPGKFQFARIAYDAVESDGSVIVTVRRADGSAGTATVSYAATNGGTATAGADFNLTSGTLTFLNNELEKTFTVAILEDQTIEPTESINLVLSNPTGGATLGASNATINVADNDAPPVVSIGGTVIYGTTPANQTPKKVYGAALSATGATNNAATTDTNGAYTLNNLVAGGTYQIALAKIGDVNGITAFDATLVLRHVAAAGQGQNALSVNQQLAADANNSGTITAFDATQILRFVAAGNQTATTGAVGTWKFAPAARTYDPLGNSMSDEDYTAVLIGEVNGNWNPPTVFESFAANEQSPPATPKNEDSEKANDGQATSETHSEIGEIQIALPNATAARNGEILTVPIVLLNEIGKTISAYSFDLRFDPSMLRPDAANPTDVAETLSQNFSVAAATTQAGKIGIAASSSGGENANFRRGGTLLKLRFRVLRAPSDPRRSTVRLIFAAKPIFEDSVGAMLSVKGTNGSVNIVKNAEIGFVAVGGRVAIGERGIRNAIITLAAANGETRRVLTGENGYYGFSNLPAGASYTISITSKRFAFKSPLQILNVINENRDDINFTAEN